MDSTPSPGIGSEIAVDPSTHRLLTANYLAHRHQRAYMLGRHQINSQIGEANKPDFETFVFCELGAGAGRASGPVVDITVTSRSLLHYKSDKIATINKPLQSIKDSQGSHMDLCRLERGRQKGEGLQVPEGTGCIENLIS